MDIDLLFPTLPPTVDGIGDHTAHLAQNLAERESNVRIWTAEKEASQIPGVNIQPVLQNGRSVDISEAVISLSKDPPDWLLVQYNPFSYGSRGWNPYVIFALRRLLSLVPGLRIAAIVHEPFLPSESLRWAIMSTWQRWQFRSLGQLADTVFFSTENWTSTFAPWFPESNVLHLPVGSNIPIIPGDYRSYIRDRHQVAEETFVVGVFGSGHPSRLLSFVAAALESIRTVEPSVEVFYIGTASDKIQRELSEFRVHDAGALPAEDVSRYFRAMDLYLAPFRKGVSSRRGSFWTGVQHGIATVSTYGIHTGPTLHNAAGTAFLLTSDSDPAAYARSARNLVMNPQRRTRIAARGAHLFAREYAWPVLADRLLAALHDPPSHTELRTSSSLSPPRSSQSR